MAYFICYDCGTAPRAVKICTACGSDMTRIEQPMHTPPKQLCCPECGDAHSLSQCPTVRSLRNCINCVFLIQQDTGYSNYTVEDTEVYCGVRQHSDPDATVSKPYDVWEKPREWKWGDEALQCDWFHVGVGPHMDVDGGEREEKRKVRQIQAVAKLGQAAAEAWALGLFEPDISGEKEI